MKINYDKLPLHMVEGIQNYIEYGYEPGSFLKAVLLNDFMGAASKADEVNARYLREWALFLYNDAPGECYGDKETYDAWIKSGGTRGQRML